MSCTLSRLQHWQNCVGCGAWRDVSRAAEFAATELKRDILSKEFTRDTEHSAGVPYYKATWFTRGWTDRAKASRFVAILEKYDRAGGIGLG